jgi:hypothetical protein
LRELPSHPNDESRMEEPMGEVVQGVRFVINTEGTQKADKVLQQLDALKAKAGAAGEAGAAGMNKLAGGINNVASAASKAPGAAIAADLKKAEQAAGILDPRLRALMQIGAPLAAIAGIGILTKTAIDAADELHDMATKTGLAAEQLSVLGYAAKLNDTNLQSVLVGFKGMANALDNAAHGGKEAQQSFAAVGITLDDLRHKTPGDLFIAVANGLQKIPDPATRAAKAQDLLGRSAQELLPLLNDISGNGLKRFTEEAERLGLVVSTQTANAADEFNDSLERLKGGAMGAFNAVATYLLPALTTLTRYLNDEYKPAASDAATATSKIGEEAERQHPKLNKLALGLIAISTAAKSMKEAGKFLLEGGRGALAGLADGHDPLDGVQQSISNIETAWKRYTDALKRIQDEGGKALDASTQPYGTGAGGAAGTNRTIKPAKDEEAEKLAAARARELDALKMIRLEEDKILAVTSAQTELERKLAMLEADREKQNERILQMRHLTAQEQFDETAHANEAYAKARQNVLNDAVFDENKKALATSAKFAKEINDDLLEKNKARFAGTKRAIEETLDAEGFYIRNLRTMYENLANGFSNATKQAFYDVFSGGDIMKSVANFVDAFRAALSDMLGNIAKRWMNDLVARAQGLPDSKGNIPSGSQQRNAQAGLAGIQSATLLYGLYQNGQNGAGRGQNALSGLVGGAAVGAQIGSIVPGIGTLAGAIVGGLIGGIAGYFTGSSGHKAPDVASGIRVGASGATSLYGQLNLKDDDQKSAIQKIQSAYDSIFNGFVQTLLKLPGLKGIPGGNGEIAQGYFKGQMGDWTKYIDDFVNHKLPEQIAGEFKTAFSKGFEAAGIGSNQFEKFWQEASGLSGDQAIRFWSDMADGLESFRVARARMANLSGISDLGLARFDQTGTAQPFGKSDFETSVRASSKGIFDIARAMVTLTGPDKVAAFKQLGASVADVTKSLADYLQRVGNALKSLRATFDSTRLEMQISQYDQKVDENGNVVRQGDPNAQARLLEAQYNKDMYQIQHAKELGLSPEDVTNLSTHALGLLGRIYDLDPSDEAYKWWTQQADTLEKMSDDALKSLGDAAKSAVQKLIDEVQPFVDWFNGIPVNLDAALKLIEDDALPGFAEAINDLANRIRNVDLTPPGTNPNPKPEPTDPTDPERGGKRTDATGGRDLSVTVNLNGTIIGSADLAQQVYDAVLDALVATPNILDSTYAA